MPPGDYPGGFFWLYRVFQLNNHGPLQRQACIAGGSHTFSESLSTTLLYAVALPLPLRIGDR